MRIGKGPTKPEGRDDAGTSVVGHPGVEGPIAQFWLERTPDKREVGSSSLPRPTISFWTCGELAQLGERLPCTQEVTGSNPVFSTKFEVETEAF